MQNTRKVFRKVTLLASSIATIAAVFITANEIPDREPPQQVITVIEDPVSKLTSFDHKQIACLAQNMYFEARNQTDEGIRAVGFVTLNRLKSGDFANTVCNVVHERNVPHSRNKCQFSWYCDSKENIIDDPVAWSHVYALAINIYMYYNKMSDVTGGATYYHAKHAKPEWQNEFRRTTMIDDHIFYVKD